MKKDYISEDFDKFHEWIQENGDLSKEDRYRISLERTRYFLIAMVYVYRLKGDSIHIVDGISISGGLLKDIRLIESHVRSVINPALGYNYDDLSITIGEHKIFDKDLNFIPNEKTEG